MELGISLPTLGPLATPRDVVRMAQGAERLGYATVWTCERLLRPIGDVPAFGGAAGPDGFNAAMYDPIETLSHVAAVTERIGLATGVVDALFHSPVVLAHRYATLDRFSGGRAIAGLGQGWLPEEFAACNVPMRRRGAGFDDFVAALRACFGPDPVQYQGRFYEIAPSLVNPKPARPRLPILLGVGSAAGAHRAARIADGLLLVGMSVESVRELITEFRTACAAHGRTELPVYVRGIVPITDEPITGRRPFLGGTPEQVTADIAILADLDVHQIVLFNVAPGTVDDT